MEVLDKQVINELTSQRLLGRTYQVTNILLILKPLTFPLLEVRQRTQGGQLTHTTPLLLATVHKWLNIYHNLLEWWPISHALVIAPLMSPSISVFLIKNKFNHCVGVLLTGTSLACILWPDGLQKLFFVAPKACVAFPHVLLLSVSLLCTTILQADSLKNSHFACYTDLALLAIIMRKGCDKWCLRTSMITISLLLLDALPSFELYPAHSSKSSSGRHTHSSSKMAKAHLQSAH